MLSLLTHVFVCCSGPVMKLYLWDKAASDFSEKFKASGGTARVALVTTLNPKRFGGPYYQLFSLSFKYLDWQGILSG